MNRPSPFAANGLFKPASHYLNSTANTASELHRRSPSLDDSDTELGKDNAVQEKEIPRSTYLTPVISNESPSVPLIDHSRSPSPFTRSESTAQLEDKVETVTFNQDLEENEPLVTVDLHGRSRATQVLYKDGLGQFFFGTATGWKTYTSLLIFWVGGCHFSLLLVNKSVSEVGPYTFVAAIKPSEGVL